MEEHNAWRIFLCILAGVILIAGIYWWSRLGREMVSSGGDSAQEAESVVALNEEL